MKTNKFKVVPIYEKRPEEFEPVGIKPRVYTKEGESFTAYLPDTEEYATVTKAGKIENRLHDSAKYTKVFHQTNKVLRHLTTAASNLLFHIINSLTVGQDHICISEDDFLTEFGYSINSRKVYYTAVLELIDLKVIAKKSGDTRCYWINTNIIYNGDRTKLVSYDK